MTPFGYGISGAMLRFGYHVHRSYAPHGRGDFIQDLLSQGFFATDKLTDYLEIIKQTTKYKKWFFGHYHTDVALNEKDFCVFEKIMQVA